MRAAFAKAKIKIKIGLGTLDGTSVNYIMMIIKIEYNCI